MHSRGARPRMRLPRCSASVPDVLPTSVRWISRTCSALVWLKKSRVAVDPAICQEGLCGNCVAMMTPSPNARPSRMRGSRNGEFTSRHASSRTRRLLQPVRVLPTDEEAVQRHEEELGDGVLHLIAGQLAEPDDRRSGEQVVEGCGRIALG